MSRVCAVQGCETLYNQEHPTNAESSNYLDAIGPSGPWSVSGVNLNPSNSKEIFICKHHIETAKRKVDQPIRKSAVMAHPEYRISPPSNDASATLPGYCRLCLTEDGPMVVPKEAKVFQQLAMKITACLQMTIPVDELRNSLMCKKCYEMLEQSYQFRLRCSRYNVYLKMRKSLDPDRSQPLRYKENWYWYSCLGNNLKSVYWGCSVVCCPAYIVTYPSGKVNENFARHQHKQKLDEVRLVYGSGEFIHDGFRYSFDMINPNRTLQFSCRSLNDPYKKCGATLTSNDKSEVLTFTEHNHPMETILESALRESGTNEKRSVTMIRGQHLELVVCLGFWYGTMADHSRISHWDCIRPNCTGSITMTDGVMQLHGGHNHQPVWLKWGAAASKVSESKVPMVMKILNLTAAKQQPPQAKKPPVHVVKPNASQSGGQIVVRSASSLTQVPSPVNNTVEQTALENRPITIKGEVVDPEYYDLETSEQDIVQFVLEKPNVPAIVSTNNVGIQQTKPQTTGGTVTVRQNHPIKIVRPAFKRLVPILPAPPPPPPPSMPKILNVMSLSDQPRPVPVPEPLILTKNEDELAAEQAMEEDEAETITDEVLPESSSGGQQQPSSEVRPMMLVSSGSVTSDNTLKVTALDEQFSMAELTGGEEEQGQGNGAAGAEEVDEDVLCDLMDDEEIPGIIPVDIQLYQTTYTSPPQPAYKPAAVPEQPKRLSNSALSGKPSASSVVAPAPVKIPARHSLPATVQHRNPSQKNVIPLKKPLHPIAMVAKLNDKEPVKRIGSKVFQIHNTTIKKFKADSTTAPQKRSVESVPLDSARVDKDPQTDPIAVATEPHEHVEDANANGDAPPKKQTVTLVQPTQRQPKPVAPKPSGVKPAEPTNAAAKTVQLVKLQKSEQMLNYEGHLYKIKWSNDSCFYWDCMLREQVSCMAILETPSDARASSQWVRHGTHNHKIPKPIANEDSSGRYQMFNANTGIAKMKRVPQRTLSAVEVEEQKGRMMYLKKNKLLSYSVSKPDGKLVLNYANFIYDLLVEQETGFRWKCTTCASMLDTDEKFSIAKTVGEMHNHGPKVPVIDLAVDEAPAAAATLEEPASGTATPVDVAIEKEDERTTESEQDATSIDPLSEQPTTSDTSGQVSEKRKKVLKKLKRVDDKLGKRIESGDDDASRESGGKPDGRRDSKKTNDIPKKVKRVPTKETEKKDDSVATESMKAKSDDEEMVLDSLSGQLISLKELKRKEMIGEEETSKQLKAEEKLKPALEEKSDDEEMVLDPSSGQLITRLDLKRQENRAALLGDLEDKDDDATVLDPLTGEFKRQGDLNSTILMEPTEIDENSESNTTQPQEEPPKEDFEELLSTSKSAKPADVVEPQKSPPKRLKKGSLAMLKLIMELHKSLLKADPERNFEVVPRPDNTCWIKFNEFPYMLEKLQSSNTSLWCCALPPQYACRSKLVLDDSRKTVTSSYASHCHTLNLKDMFDGHEAQEEGEIRDTDQDDPRRYTFSKQPDFVYQLKLDDDYLYNCLTISKTGISCWRCASRQKYNCKAMVTMVGDFESMTRNRFTHSHGVPGAEEEEEGDKSGGVGEEAAAEEETGAKGKRDSVGEEDGEASRKKRKRQTL
uniref:Putative ark protein kinase family n=2 Tax=Culex tarsalis TaxID=7177 RepID=A0A1Q3F9M9_CULTA